MANTNVVAFRAATHSGVVAPGGVSKQSLDMLGRARDLVAMAESSEPDEGIELSYRAALRGAGALLHQGVEGKAKRRRGRSQSAWVNLKAERPEFVDWVERFERYSGIRNELRLGLVRKVGEAEARQLVCLVEDFLAVVEADLGVLPAVA
nr:SAV_6107 family HEPN domain-containing protein [Corynebacterium lactis]